jgi:hypothetical protein
MQAYQLKLENVFIGLATGPHFLQHFWPQTLIKLPDKVLCTAMQDGSCLFLTGSQAEK